MKQEYVNKSRLYREGYLPAGTVKLRGSAFGQVVGTYGTDDSLNDIDKDQLIWVVKRFVSEWEELPAGAVEGGLKLGLERHKEMLHVQSPTSIFVSPFPLLLKCKSCNKLDFYGQSRNEQEILKSIAKRRRKIKNKQRVACKDKSCRGYMLQLPYMSVHRCGSVGSIFIPYEARHTAGVNNLVFNDKGGAFFHNQFIDGDTGDVKNRALQEPCRYCVPLGEEGSIKKGSQIVNGDGFFPQSVQYVALKKVTGELVSWCLNHMGSVTGSLDEMNRDVAEGVAAVICGIHSRDEFVVFVENMIGGNMKSEEEIAGIREHIKKIDALIAGYAPIDELDKDSMDWVMVNSFHENKKKLEGNIKSSTGYFSKVRDYLDNDTALHQLATSRRSLESIFITKDCKEQNWTSRISNEPDAMTRKQLESNHQYIMANYGVSNISHLNDINVVLSTVGFSREKRSPNIENPESNVPVTLNGFQDKLDSSLNGKRCLYAMSAKTEGVLIRFDPRKILRWCIDAMGWSDPGEEVTQDFSRAKAHLLMYSPALTIEPSKVTTAMRERGDNAVKEAAPFNLLHTISHCLLASIKRHTGYEDKSVMEYLLPMDLSIVLYVTSVQNYTAGGLMNLFKHYLRPWLDDASNYALSCVFDPICSDKGASCSGCTQIVIGCETFNYDLSRSYIHGGNIETNQVVKKGFWGN